MAQFIHYCAKNDRNGNPQRCYVLIDPDNGNPIATWDEQYYGLDCVPGIWRTDAYHAERITCSIAKYKELLRTLPSPDWAPQVPGYEHLTSVCN